MPSHSWWKRLIAMPSHSPLRRNRSTRLMEFEVLEDRLVPAVIFVPNTSDGLVDLPGMVNNGGGRFTAPNLRTAVEFANNRPGADVVRLNTATYHLSDSYGGQIAIESVLTIKNRFGGDNQSIIDAHDQSRIFETYGGSVVKLDHLTLTNGRAPAPLFDIAYGGAIFNQGNLTVLNSLFIGNHAIGRDGAEGFAPEKAAGGAIYNASFNSEQPSTLKVVNTLFSGNTAEGGSDENYNGAYDGAGAEGGAIAFAFNTGPSSITASTFDQNRAVGGNASFYRGESLPGGSYGGNGGTAYGGAVCVEHYGAQVNIVNSTFANNEAVGGAGFYVDDGGYGGGSYGSVGGGAFGGAIAVRANLSEDSTVNLVNDTIAENYVLAGYGYFAGSAYGGGVANLSPIFEDEADSETGAEQVTGANVINVLNTIIADNYASYASVGAADSDVSISTSTSGGNSDDVFGIFDSRGHNLIGNTDHSVGFNSGFPQFDLLNIPEEYIGLDPNGLQDNGGPTPTIALLITSSAINAGDNVVMQDNFESLGISKLKTDQRGPGFPRKIAGIVDIGAYEFKINLDKSYTFRSASVPVTFRVPAPGVLAGAPPMTDGSYCVTFENITNGAGTSLSLLEDGSFFFTVPPRFNRTVQFRFRVCVVPGDDGGEGRPVSTNFVFTATIHVLPTGGRGSAGAFLGLGLGIGPPVPNGNPNEENPPH
ncbi:MAG: hypothetical protein HYX68_12015 [Planctomycetes bacterium]|nr:hypothetical protein [Planctomycetota bacterium]